MDSSVTFVAINTVHASIDTTISAQFDLGPEVDISRVDFRHLDENQFQCSTLIGDLGMMRYSIMNLAGFRGLKILISLSRIKVHFSLHMSPRIFHA